MKPQELSLQCEALEDFVNNLDAALKITAKALLRKKMKNGTVSAKIDIEINEITNQDGEVFNIMSIKPAVNMKIGSKDKMEPQQVHGMYIKQDDDGTPIVGSNQISIDELINEQRGA